MAKSYEERTKGLKEMEEYFRQMQLLSYDAKVRVAHQRVREFENGCYERELNTHVSAGQPHEKK